MSALSALVRVRGRHGASSPRCRDGPSVQAADGARRQCAGNGTLPPV